MRFDGIFPVWLILFLLLLTVFFLWQEWNRNHRFKAIRMIAVLAMMLSLAGILLKPKYISKDSSSILLLTPGYSSTKVDSLLKAYPSLQLMHTIQTTSYKNSSPLPYFDLANPDKDIRFIVGQGLPRHVLDLLEKKNFSFIPAVLPEGIIELSIPSISYPSRRNFISGKLRSSHDGWLYLKSPGKNEDSVKFSKGINDFRLSFVSPYPGDFLYTVSVREGATEIQHEYVPVHIEQDQSLNILFLQHHPTFETQQLKNFLARKRHHVVLRHQLSKNNFRFEYLNTAAISVHRINPDLLETFDLVIVDNESLQALPGSEKEFLLHAVKSGLGMLNISLSEKAKTSAFFPFETTFVKSDTTIVSIENHSYNLPATRVRVIENAAVSATQKNKTGILGGFGFVGLGRIGFQSLQETYRLMLSGDSIAYSQLWGPLLEKVSRRQNGDAKPKIITPFPWFENEPIDVTVISSTEKVFLTSDSITLPLREDVNIDNVWYGRTWAGSLGWYRLTANESSLPYFVSPEGSWNSLDIKNQIEATRRQANSDSSDLERAKIWKEIPSISFYLVFLAAAGFLWLAPKL
jgi:hypothetical protein